jgi:glycosyltransferase involved in cell wall biosynthesis
VHILTVTHSASPYQVELFDKIAGNGEVDLTVVYLHRFDPTRDWDVRDLSHKALCLGEELDRHATVRSNVQRADLAVFNYYAEKPARDLLALRAASQKPWCFWGERLGFRKPEWLGQIARRFLLSCLHQTKAPIWGIGQFALERYRREFGNQRAYWNIPYFSNLDRFQTCAGKLSRRNTDRTILFSGSLIHRKGVDLLAQAFLRVARIVPGVRLAILGEGELRSTLMGVLSPVRERVEFLGFKDWDELPRYYGAADVLCVPSRYDGWGLVVPEGLASGLSVIGTDRTGAALEFVKTGINGWLIPANDEDALYVSLCQAATLPKERLSEISRAARASVTEHTLQAGAQRFIDAAHDAVSNWQH